MQTDSYLQFGPFRLEVGAGLWRHDSEIRLPPKEMALLELLVQSQGEVVTHEAIYKNLWPRQLIGYHSLARCVYSLRKALRPEGREYIKTVSKRGYQLTVPVDNVVQQHHRSALESSIQTGPLPHAHFLKGLACVNQPDPDSLERALHWFRKSIQIDPDFAAAHSAVAEVSMYQCYRGFIHPQGGLRVGLEACNAALRSDPNIVQALSLRGWFEALQMGEMERGIESVEHARRLDPEYSRTYAYQALIHRAQGDMEAAVDHSAQAVELDPHSLFNSYAHAFTLFLAGHVAEALQFERQFLESNPGDDLAHGYMSLFLASLGEHREALDFAHNALSLAKNTPAMWGFMAWSLAVCGETEEAGRLVEKAYAAHLPRCPRPIMAPALVALGKPDQALSSLSEARKEQCPWFFGARVDPRLEDLRGDKRWRALYP
jgi:DNA-binding winged helix-turn-helix (wHTH) protein/Tfp pilus assembly protein PilF